MTAPVPPAIPYWHVDAFADRPFAGNQAAVMRLDAQHDTQHDTGPGIWPDDATLQAIAAENMFAETAFIVPDTQDDAADWALRWFTPEVEVRLCGHATLATGHVLLDTAPAGAAVRFRTRQAGILEVRRVDARWRYEVGLPAIATAPGAFAAAVAGLGGPPPRETWRSPDGYAVFVYGSEAEVRALAPDFRALAALGDELLIATAPATQMGPATDVVSRAFAPGAGIDEDPVTGSAHAAIAPIWAAKLGRGSFTAYQASRRGGHVACRLDGDRVWLGGDCRTVVEGLFRL